MFGIGMGEILLVSLVAVIFFGPDDFIKLTRFAARGIREFRVFKQQLKDSVEKDFTSPENEKQNARNGAGKP